MLKQARKRLALLSSRRKSKKAPPRRPRTIMADKFVMQWAHALGVDPGECRRIVIDAEVGNVLRIHVEKLGDERMLDVRPPSRHAAEVHYCAPGANATALGDTWTRRVG